MATTTSDGYTCKTCGRPPTHLVPAKSTASLETLQCPCGRTTAVRGVETRRMSAQVFNDSVLELQRRAGKVPA